MINLRTELSQAINQITGVKIFSAFPDDFKVLPCIGYILVDNAPTVQSTDGEEAALIQYNIHVFAKTMTEAESLATQVNAKMVELGYYREGLHPQVEELKHLILSYSAEVDVVTLEKFKN